MKSAVIVTATVMRTIKLKDVSKKTIMTIFRGPFLPNMHFTDQGFQVASYANFDMNNSQLFSELEK